MLLEKMVERLVMCQYKMCFQEKSLALIAGFREFIVL